MSWYDTVNLFGPASSCRKSALVYIRSETTSRAVLDLSVITEWENGPRHTLIAIVDTGGLARILIDMSKEQALGLLQLLSGNCHGIRQDPPRQVFAGRFRDTAIVSVKKHGGKELVRVWIKSTNIHLSDKGRRVVVTPVHPLVGIVPVAQVAFPASASVGMPVIDNLKLIQNGLKVGIVSIGRGLNDNANGRNAGIAGMNVKHLNFGVVLFAINGVFRWDLDIVGNQI